MIFGKLILSAKMTVLQEEPGYLQTQSAPTASTQHLAQLAQLGAFGVTLGALGTAGTVVQVSLLQKL